MIRLIILIIIKSNILQLKLKVFWFFGQAKMTLLLGMGGVVLNRKLDTYEGDQRPSAKACQSESPIM